MKPTAQPTPVSGEPASSIAPPQQPQNPYESSSAAEFRAPGGHFLLVRLGVSVAVLAGSLVILHALMFGCAIAIAGYLIPGPFQFADVMSSPVGPWIKVGSLICVPICLAMSVYCYGRIARAQRALVETMARRNELHRQLHDLRNDYAAIEQSRRSAENIGKEGAR
jgi:hypothetical protein